MRPCPPTGGFSFCGLSSFIFVLIQKRNKNQDYRLSACWRNFSLELLAFIHYLTQTRKCLAQTQSSISAQFRPQFYGSKSKVGLLLTHDICHKRKLPSKMLSAEWPLLTFAFRILHFAVIEACPSTGGFCGSNTMTTAPLLSPHNHRVCMVHHGSLHLGGGLIILLPRHVIFLHQHRE